MKRRFLSLIGVLTLAMSMNVYAADVTVTSNSHSDDIPTSFTVTDDMLGGEVILSVPSEMVLTLSADGLKLTDTDTILAKGDIVASKHLELSVPTSLTYKNDADTSIEVPGSLTFETNGYTEWSADELEANLTSPTYKDISVDVDMDDIDYIGVYRATITYNVKVETN